MRTCGNCRKTKDASRFYPETGRYARQTECRDCIVLRIAKRKASTKSSRTRRARQAVLAVMASVQQGREPYVYLVGSPQAYKVGTSTDVATRVKALNTGHSELLTLIASAPGGRALEREIHARLKRYRIAGEWFIRNDAVLHAFLVLPGALVFLPGYMKTEAPPSATNVSSSVN